jgi:hypothetical protein
MFCAYLPESLQKLTFRFIHDSEVLTDVPLMKNNNKLSATELIATHKFDDKLSLQEYLLNIHNDGLIICDCSIFRQLFVVAKEKITTGGFLLYVGDELGHVINANKDTFYLRPKNNEMCKHFLKPFNHKGVWLQRISETKYIGLDDQIYVMSKEEWTVLMKANLEKDIEKYISKENQDDGVLARRELYEIYSQQKEFNKWTIENLDERYDIII